MDLDSAQRPIFEAADHLFPLVPRMEHIGWHPLQKHLRFDLAHFKLDCFCVTHGRMECDHFGESLRPLGRHSKCDGSPKVISSDQLFRAVPKLEGLKNGIDDFSWATFVQDVLGACAAELASINEWLFDVKEDNLVARVEVSWHLVLNVLETEAE